MRREKNQIYRPFCRTFGYSERHSGQRNESFVRALSVDHFVGEEVHCQTERERKNKIDKLETLFPFTQTHSSLNGSMRRRRNSSRRSSQRSDKIKLDTKPKSKLIDSEEAATGAVGLGVYIRYFKSIGIFMGLGAIACNAIQQACSVYSSSR